MDRLAIYLDGGYIDSVLRQNFANAAIDYGKLVAAMADNCNLLRAYYYNCPPYQSNPPTPEERQRFSAKQAFYTALSRLDRFEVRKGKLAKRGNDQNGRPIFMQKRVDIMLGVDLVQLAATRQIQQAILFAGDSDFLPAIEAAKTHGVMISLWHGRKSHDIHNTVHQALWDACDERTEITQEFIDSILR